MILLDLRSSSDLPRSSEENRRTLSSSASSSCAAAWAAACTGRTGPPPVSDAKSKQTAEVNKQLKVNKQLNSPLLVRLKEWGGVDVAVAAAAGVAASEDPFEESLRTRSVFGFGVRGGGGGGVLVSGERSGGENELSRL